MNYLKSDLSRKVRLNLILNKGVIYTPFLKGISDLDTDYTFTIEYLGISYNSGNGLKIVDSTKNKAIIFYLDTSLIDAGNYIGRIKSVNNTYNVYLDVVIHIRIK